MTSVRDITATDVLDEDPVTVNIGQPLSKVRTLMEDNYIRALPVVDGQKFVGMLSYRDVMEKIRSDPSTTQAEALTHTPPTVDGEQNLVQLSGLRINSGRKKFVSLDEHDRLNGTVGEEEIAYAARETDELANLSVDDVMTADLLTVRRDASIDTARKRMMDSGVSRLVVLDEDDELVGVITSLDTLRAMVSRNQMSAGTGNKRGRTTGTSSGDVAGEKESFSDIPVSEIMQTPEEIDAELVERGTSLPEAISIIEGSDALEVVVMEDGAPVGIVTVKDVVDNVASYEPVDSMLVQLTGPEVPEEKEAIHAKIENQIQGGLGRVLERPEELGVHVKKYEKDGTQHKYTINFHLTSELGTLRVNAHGWDLLDAVDEGLDKLETLVKKKKGKMRDEARERQREGKYSRD